MAEVMPKVKLFIFISIICLLINIGVCLVAFASQQQAYTDYISQTGSNSIDYNVSYEENVTSPENVTIGTFAIATGTSFVPYFSIVPLAFLGIDGDIFFFVAIILGIISTIQLFLIIVIVLNLLPKVFGSGFDV